MSRTHRDDAAPSCWCADDSSRFVAAYCDGLGLVALIVVRRPDGLRICAAVGDSSAVPGPDAVEARWWCRSAAEARQLAAAVTLRLRRRREAGRPIEGRSGLDDAEALAFAASLIPAEATRRGLALLNDEETVDQALRALRRVDQEIEELQRCGGLKSVNQAYRRYRLDSSARGEAAMRYDAWMRTYRETMLRHVATTLRTI